MSNFLIDYLAIRTCSFDDPAELICSFLGLPYSLFSAAAGRYGYSASFRHGNISVYYGGSPSMGICLELTGMGCREYELQKEDENALIKLIRKLSPDDAVTRVDFAFDDRCGRLTFEQILQKKQANEIRTAIRSTAEILQDDGNSGHSLYFGSSHSTYRVRIYDKAAEQQEDGPWMRVEEILRKEVATQFIWNFLITIDKDLPLNWQMTALASMAAGFLMKKISFVEMTETNISRCPISSWWREFLGDVKPYKLDPKRSVPSIDTAENWLRKSVAPTLGALCLIKGPDWFLQFLARSVQSANGNARYLTLYDSLTAHGKDAVVIGDNAGDSFMSMLSDTLKERKP